MKSCQKREFTIPLTTANHQIKPNVQKKGKIKTRFITTSLFFCRGIHWKCGGSDGGTYRVQMIEITNKIIQTDSKLCNCVLKVEREL